MFSIIVPMDANRIEQFTNTKHVYDGMKQVKEFIIPTRTKNLKKLLKERDLSKDVKIIQYELREGFNVSKALNIGVRNATYDNIIITSPEVRPMPDVLDQFEYYKGKNVIAQVFDQDKDGNLSVLVSEIFRAKTPAMYFLAMFQKKDIEAINGWDEDFCKGYAYEDNDFGDRWIRAKLPFQVIDDIQGLHQYHERSETIPGGLNINARHFQENGERMLIRPANGLVKLSDDGKILAT